MDSQLTRPLPAQHGVHAMKHSENEIYDLVREKYADSVEKVVFSAYIQAVKPFVQRVTLRSTR